MDTGLSPALETVIARHPDWTIGQNTSTGRWEAISRPRPTTEVYVHAATLEQLAAALDAEAPS